MTTLTERIMKVILENKLPKKIPPQPKEGNIFEFKGKRYRITKIYDYCFDYESEIPKKKDRPRKVIIGPRRITLIYWLYNASEHPCWPEITILK